MSLRQIPAVAMLLVGLSLVSGSATDQGVSPSGTPLRVGSGVSAARLIRKVEPEYAEAARKARVEGMTVLYVEVGPDGLAHSIRIFAPSLDPGLDRQAIKAVEQWRFEPGMKDGKPVTVVANIEVNFRLLKKPGQSRIDYRSAEKFYRRAAVKGNADAEYSLGAIYYEGAHHKEAREWFEKAAAQGLPQAEYRLGVLYQKGQGVAQNPAEAQGWFEKAASHTDYRSGIMALPGAMGR